MHQYAIAAMGNDKPGIVAAVGEALVAIDSNIDDSSMTILGGHFAMLLVVQSQGDQEQMQAALAPVAERFDLLLEVREVVEHHLSLQERDDYVVSAYGPDKQGLVLSLSRVLATAHANITDFGSRLGADGTFAMWFNASLADGTDVPQLARQLERAGTELGLDVRLYRAEAEGL